MSKRMMLWEEDEQEDNDLEEGQEEEHEVDDLG